MEFHDFPTIYSVLKHNGLDGRDPGQVLRRCPRHAAGSRPGGTPATPWRWSTTAPSASGTGCGLGSPYFKVYPAMIPLLSGVGIEVPVDYLRLPFCAFAVRLPAEGNPLVIDDQYYVRSILACDGQPVDTQERRVYLWIDVGERAMGNSPVLTYCQLECVPGIQIEEAFNRLPQEPDIPGVCVPRELQARCLRLVVSVCFLATGGDRLVEPDVLGKDLAAYIEAQRRDDRQRVEQIVQRAVRRGKKGWHVGQHERFRRGMPSGARGWRRSAPSTSSTSGGPISVCCRRRRSRS